jgi:hypothetical protein
MAKASILNPPLPSPLANHRSGLQAYRGSRIRQEATKQLLPIQLESIVGLAYCAQWCAMEAHGGGMSIQL